MPSIRIGRWAPTGRTSRASTATARYQYQAGYTLFSPLFADDTGHPTGNTFPILTVFRTDNRSRYDGLSVHLQANVRAASAWS